MAKMALLIKDKKLKKLIAFIILLVIFALSYCGSGKTETKSEQTKTEKTATSDTTETADSIKVTFIEIGSENCIPCKKMEPILDEIRKEYPTQVEVIFYDVKTHKGRLDAQPYHVAVIPTQVFLNEIGQEYHRHIGFYPIDKVLEALAKGGVKIKKGKKEEDKE